MNIKPKIAIFDLTDCEGCELMFLNFKEKFPELIEKVEILNWRLISDNEDWLDIDYTFVEGTPIKPNEIKLLQKIRENSKYVIALGTCAATGGFPALIDPAKRDAAFRTIYPGKNPHKSQQAKPISHYIKIDYILNGCPVTISDLSRFFNSILAGVMPQPKNYPVCLPCRARQNKCLLLEGKSCMGPLTNAGCNAVCPFNGFPCFGCLGPIKDANIKALKKRFQKIGLKPDEIDKWVTVCWRNLKEYKRLNYKSKKPNHK